MMGRNVWGEGSFNDQFLMNNDQLKGKIKFFESALLDFFKKAGREHLPWRREGISAYEVWVSEIMLQQTQVSRVIPYYEKFLERFSDVEMLAVASWEEFLPYYAGLGYYARGRNMLRTAKMVVENFGGEFPRDIRELESLPGIGCYTARAIASFACDENVLAWDTNLRRVVGRFFFGTKRMELAEMEKVGERFLSRAKHMNAALMDFGSAICLGKPKCGACPLAPKCRYRRENGKQESSIRHRASGISSGKEKRRVKTEKIQWREARVEVTLHENHTKYFSSVEESYQPFLVPASHNTRAGIKSWFRERYGLEVSVRPPHRKAEISGIPTIFVNVQILSGTHSFREFSKVFSK